MAQEMATGKKLAAPATTPPKTATAKPPKTAPPKAAPPKPEPKVAVSRPASAPEKPAVAATGKWRIQLGAFSQRKSAEALYGKLSARLGGRQAYYVPAGAVVRLQAGPYESRSAASAACARLAPQACFPVEGR